MNKIKTNYTTNSKLVLTNDESLVVAIINVPIGADITKQVLLAIKEDLCVVSVDLTENIDFDTFDGGVIINVVTTDEDGENFDREFYLTLTAEY